MKDLVGLMKFRYIIKDIKTYGKNVKKKITYSDSCSVQNINIKTVLSLLKPFQNTEIRGEAIEMKFLVNEHS